MGREERKERGEMGNGEQQLKQSCEVVDRENTCRSTIVSCLSSSTRSRERMGRNRHSEGGEVVTQQLFPAVGGRVGGRSEGKLTEL